MLLILRAMTVCLLLVGASSICSGTEYWNPLNNACVDGT